MTVHLSEKHSKGSYGTKGLLPTRPDGVILGPVFFIKNNPYALSWSFNNVGLHKSVSFGADIYHLARKGTTVCFIQDSLESGK